MKDQKEEEESLLNDEEDIELLLEEANAFGLRWEVMVSAQKIMDRIQWFLNQKHMYKHITNGLNKMSKQSEDTMYRIYHEVEEKKLRRKFDKQLKKMNKRG